MPDYQNGKIYTIRYRLDESLLYVGSTTQPLHKRWYEHRRKHNNPNSFNYNTYLSFKMRGTNDINNWHIELYELYPCNTKKELERKEGQVIRLLNANLNQVIAGRSYQEWYEDNKERLKEYNKTYHQEHKEEQNRKSKEYREKNKEKIQENDRQRSKVYYKNNQEKIAQQKKLYNERNKERIKEQKRVYREKNKDKIKEEVICECGCEIQKYQLNRHKKSAKHQLLMENKSST